MGGLGTFLSRECGGNGGGGGRRARRGGSGSKDACCILSLPFQTSPHLSFPWTYATKMSGICPGRLIGTWGLLEHFKKNLAAAGCPVVSLPPPPQDADLPFGTSSSVLVAGSPTGQLGQTEAKNRSLPHRDGNLSFG